MKLVSKQPSTFTEKYGIAYSDIIFPLGEYRGLKISQCTDMGHLVIWKNKHESIDYIHVAVCKRILELGGKLTKADKNKYAPKKGSKQKLKKVS